MQRVQGSVSRDISTCGPPTLGFIDNWQLQTALRSCSHCCCCQWKDFVTYLSQSKSHYLSSINMSTVLLKKLNLFLLAAQLKSTCTLDILWHFAHWAGEDWPVKTYSKQVFFWTNIITFKFIIFHSQGFRSNWLCCVFLTQHRSRKKATCCPLWMGWSVKHMMFS